LAVLVLGSVALSACSTTSTSSTAHEQPARLEQVAGTGQRRIVLTTRAAERLGIETAVVTSEGFGSSRMVIPYAAVVYAANGATSTYTSPEKLTFVREPVTVERIDGDRALLSVGPAAGSSVVTTGAPELLGVESGVGH
jgi:hypothetical protein